MHLARSTDPPSTEAQPARGATNDEPWSGPETPGMAEAVDRLGQELAAKRAAGKLPPVQHGIRRQPIVKLGASVDSATGATIDVGHFENDHGDVFTMVVPRLPATTECRLDDDDLRRIKREARAARPTPPAPARSAATSDRPRAVRCRTPRPRSHRPRARRTTSTRDDGSTSEGGSDGPASLALRRHLRFGRISPRLWRILEHVGGAR